MTPKRLPSPAIVIAFIALAISLGGVSYAASVLPKNSVGSTQLRKGSVKPSKLSRGTIALIARGRGSGSAGAKGPKGEKGETGAKGAKGAQGIPGQQGPAGPFSDTPPSGKTLRGTYAMYGVAPGGVTPDRTSISFAFQLASAPTPHVIKQGSPTTLACPGSYADPQALPGQLCIYEDVVVNADPVVVNFSRRFGALLTTDSKGTGLFGNNGAWAVTAL